MIRIAIIIPTFNRKKYIEKLLIQIENQEIKDVENYVYVIDDGSEDGTRKMLINNFPNVKILAGDGNLWYTRSINKGFEAALKDNPDYLLTLNDDIEIDKNYLQTILDSFKDMKEPAIVGSISYTLNKPHRITFSGIKRIKWWRAKQIMYHPYLLNIDPKSLSGIYPSVMLPGRGMLIDKRIIDIIGGFEEKLIQYGSDEEFCLRALNNGFYSYINWEAIIYSYHKMTGAGTSYISQSFMSFVKNFTNKHSRIYYKKYAFILWNYGNKGLFPFAFTIIILSTIYSFFKYKRNKAD